MPQPFVISGFPRCRTYWLSKLATIEGVTSCEHEPSFNMKDFPSLFNYFFDERFAGLRYAGMSDSMVAPMLPHLAAALPNMPMLIVLRSPDEVHASLTRIGLNPENLGTNAAGISAVLKHPMVKTIPYKDLGNSYKVRSALRWAMPDIKIDIRHIDTMQKQVLTADAEEMGIIWQRSEGRVGNNKPMVTDGSYELFH